MKNALYTVAGFLAAAGLTGCLFGNSSDAPNDPGEKTRTIAYSVQGTTIITGAYPDTEAYCDGEGLRSEVHMRDPDTLEFQIAGSTLSIFPRKDTLESGAVVQIVLLFSREGSGTGLTGLWLASRQEYRLVSGTLSETEQNDQDESLAYGAHRRAFEKSWARFVNGTLTSYYEINSAKRFIFEWNNGFFRGFEPDSAHFAIALKEVDKNTVELKGLKNGETVRFSETSEGRTYSSDTPGHALHRYFFMPTACPNEEAPDWYDGFLEANAKEATGLEKSSEIPSKTGFPRHFPFDPLKTVYSLLN